MVGLRRQVALRGEAEAIRFLERGDVDGPQRSISYAGLDLHARRWAARLQAEFVVGERVLLLHPQGIELVIAFVACVYAGLVPVVCPVPPKANLKRKLGRLRAIARDCTPRCVLSEPELVARTETLLPHLPELRGATWIALASKTPEPSGAWVSPELRPEAPAFLQYSSGSTGDTRGVVISRANAVGESAMAAEVLGESPTSGVIWTPLFHDMGLATLLYLLLYGGRIVLFSAAAFAQQPLRWLRAIDHFRAESSGAPNFAFELCVRQTSPAEISLLDLRCWRTAFCGAEPIRAETLRRFAHHLAPAGFDAGAMAPAYGLAEATCLVTMATARRGSYASIQASRTELEAGIGTRIRDWVGIEAPALDRIELVSVGTPIADQRIEIVDPRTRRRQRAGELGEVWLQGCNVGSGYWERKQETRECFEARIEGLDGLWLRTGDLGFLREGQLFIAGRLKDLIVIRGRNFYPQDFEQVAANSHPFIRVEGVAAVALDELAGESLGLVVELDPRAHRRLDEPGMESVYLAIRRALASAFQVEPTRIALVRAGELLRTTSGKVRRAELRRRLMDPASRWLHCWTASMQAGESAGDPLEQSLDPASSDPDATRRYIERFLVDQLGLHGEAKPGRTRLADLAVDSLRLVGLRSQLERALDLDLPMEGLFELWQRTTLNELASALVSQRGTRGPGASGARSRLPEGVPAERAAEREEFVI